MCAVPKRRTCRAFTGPFTWPRISATTATTELRALVFERDALMRHLKSKPDLKLALQAGFKNNLRQKLAIANERTLAGTGT